MDKIYGLIGEKLSHSYSKDIHEKLGNVNYKLMEIKKDNLHSFFLQKNFNAINVTIPYKQKVIEYLNYIDIKAKQINAVNVVVNINNNLYGFNTDYYGLKYLILKNNFDIKDKKVLILGTGGTSNTIEILLKDMLVKEVIKVSRNPKIYNNKNIISYEEVYNRCANFDYIINTTPVGMYPNIYDSIIDISKFNKLLGVIDCIYNPIKTNLIFNAKQNDIKAVNGLYMLVIQAVVSNFYFNIKDSDYIIKDLNREIDKYIIDNKEIIGNIEKNLIDNKNNIVVIGMPGSGKTTYAKKISKIYNKEFVDIDYLIEKKEKETCANIILNKGEDYFRKIETEVIKEISIKNNLCISTGGGVVMRYENLKYLSYYGYFIFINKPIDKLKISEDRPLTNSLEKLKKVYNDRINKYFIIADEIVNDC